MKQFISYGSVADYVLVVLPVDNQRPYETFSCMFFSTRTEGFSVGRIERKMGQKSSPTAELIFKNVFIPDDDVWEPPGKGWRHTFETLSLSCGFIGVLGLGMARGAFERCVWYARRQKLGNRRLIDENWVQIALGDMLQGIKVVRAKAHEFAIAADTIHSPSLFQMPLVKLSMKMMPKWLLLSKYYLKLLKIGFISNAVSNFKHNRVSAATIEEFKAHASALKISGTELAVKVVNQALDIVGIEGMKPEYGIEKIFRDAKMGQIIEGTNEINRLALYIKEVEAMIQ